MCGRHLAAAVFDSELSVWSVGAEVVTAGRNSSVARDIGAPQTLIVWEIVLLCSRNSWCNPRLLLAQAELFDDELRMSGVCFDVPPEFGNKEFG